MPSNRAISTRHRSRILNAILIAALFVTVAWVGAPHEITSRSAAATLTTSSEDWSGWQHDARGTRFNPAETQITPSTVGNLKLKWSFVFPNTDGSNGSQPAVVGDTVYVGSRDGKFFALDRSTGEVKWSFDVGQIAGPSTADNPNALRDGPAVANGMVIFGDHRGFLYALDANTGALKWHNQLSTHATATITSSPLVWNGRVYVGVASSEEQAAANASYSCCTFRGQLVALDLATGNTDWRYFTVPQPTQVGTTSDGVSEFAPAGAGVWSSPVVDPSTGTVVFATGNNYSGTEGDSDSVIAVDAATGGLKWKQQLTNSDIWTVGCLEPTDQPHCPGLADGTALDYDFGAAPNIFTVNGRTLVGVGQKTGVYHTFDIHTGAIVWQQQLSVPQPNGGKSGIQWGSSYDGQRLYVATWQASPGTLFALNPATGAIVWKNPNPSDGCTTGGAAAFPDNCNLSMISAVSSTNGLVYEGSADGKMRIYRSSDGSITWQYDTVRQFTGVNGDTGSGGSISGNGGSVVSRGMLFVQSGYFSFYGIPGRVLLAFGL